jgi:hypothetical protein
MNKILLVLITSTIHFIISGALVEYAYNHSLVDMFQLNPITFGQALLLVLLANSLTNKPESPTTVTINGKPVQEQ